MKKIGTIGRKVNKALLPLFLMQTQDFQQANFHEKEQYLTNAQLRQSDFYLFVTLFGLFLGVSLVLRMILLG
jgi:hypothetical protein